MWLHFLPRRSFHLTSKFLPIFSFWLSLTHSESQMHVANLLHIRHIEHILENYGHCLNEESFWRKRRERYRRDLVFCAEIHAADAAVDEVQQVQEDQKHLQYSATMDLLFPISSEFLFFFMLTSRMVISQGRLENFLWKEDMSNQQELRTSILILRVSNLIRKGAKDLMLDSLSLNSCLTDREVGISAPMENTKTPNF